MSQSTPASKAAEISHTKFVFRRSFEIEMPVRTARFRLAADFCSATVRINGKHLVQVEPYSENVDIEVTDAIGIGRHTLEVESKSFSGPSAIAASLSIGLSNQQQFRTIVTDASWTAEQIFEGSTESDRKGQAVSLGEVSHSLWGINRRSPKIEPTENYEQWRKAVTGTTLSEDKFWTIPGFEIKLLRSASTDEGSWVSMAFDPQGRLTIGREAKGLLRMTMDDSAQSISRVEVIDDELLECRGLLYAHGALYANANGSKELYRLRDSDGDDSFDDVQLLRRFPGGGGHGRNDLALGPDEWIYSIHGDSVELPTTSIQDRTSPLRDSQRSSIKGQGHLVRTDPAGKNWEVVCTGLRNPFGLAVNDNGDWFTYDADAEFDMGTPWYRPTRIIQLRSGADYGWRAVTGKWPPYFPDHADNAMPVLDIGKGSPTAVLFPTAARFPDEYRRALLILDWTYGRILAVHMAPRGAGYRASAETFLQGRPLNVTDLAVGPDGGLFIITGGRKTQSSLYRISYAGEQLSAETDSFHEQQCKSHADAARQIRMQLESMHAPHSPYDEELVWLHLDSSDWNLRHAARVALEHQEIDRWRDRALSEERTQAAIEAWMALVRSGDPSIVSTVLDRLLKIDLSKLELSQAMGMLQCYSLLSLASTESLQARRAEIIDQLAAFLANPTSSLFKLNRCGNSLDVQGECILLLAKLGSGKAVPAAFGSLLSRPEQTYRLLGLFALRNTTQGWTKTQRQDYFQILNEGVDFVRGEGMQKFLTHIRDEATATLNQAQRQELDKLLAPVSISQEEFVPIVSRPFVRAWTMHELDELLNSVSHQADRVRGKAIFDAAQCARCHRSGTRGPAIGPDLTNVSSRFSRRDILQSIVEPSHVIAENYRSLQIMTVDGHTIVGRLLVEGDYRSQVISIATDPWKPTASVEIDKSDIESIKESPISPMPAGLLDGFTEYEILDLLEYLRG